jgi:pimeloyl-ACP methyl ester carboxylesterase
MLTSRRRSSTGGSDPSRRRARAAVVAVLTAAAAATFVASASASAGDHHAAPRMLFNHRMSVATACFAVTNPAGGQSMLYGLRYTDTKGRIDPSTPAVVLVHGIASSTENWDFSPTWSVARALAADGYVVYSYDRLGYAKSSYFSEPGGGTTLTTAAHRAELHQIVADVKSGGYATTDGSDCSARQRPSRIHNRKVVIIGHSAGGWIVAGYPGEYHDVAAMIQADIDGSNAQPPPGTSPPRHLRLRQAAGSRRTRTIPTTSSSSRRVRTARTSTPTRPAKSHTSSRSPARPRSSTRRLARSPTWRRCSPRTTPRSA